MGEKGRTNTTRALTTHLMQHQQDQHGAQMNNPQIFKMNNDKRNKLLITIYINNRFTAIAKA